MSAVVPASSNSSGAVPAGSASSHSHHRAVPSLDGQHQQPLSRYESQKRRDWNTFGQYLRNHRPPLELARCSGAHVLEFLRYLDQFGKTKVHAAVCPFFGRPHPPAPCPCPLRQAWGSLDALIGRLRAAFEENGGSPEANPFAARAVRLYLREVRDTQSKARGIAYEKKKRKRPAPPPQPSPPPPPPPLLPQGVIISSSTVTAMEAAAGLGNFQVGDLNLANEALLQMHHQQQYYHHHVHVLMSPNGSGGNGGGGSMVVTVPDSHNGSQLIPLLSVLN